MKKVVNAIALIFILTFAGLWVVVCIRLLKFDPTPETPRLLIDQGFAVVAGFFATTVGAGTAAVLGITVKDVMASGGTGSLGARVNSAVGSSPLLVVGVLVYFVVGTFVLLAFAFKSDEAPELISTFALAAAGWAGGAFSSVFKGSA